jgi:hypothetical protein
MAWSFHGAGSRDLLVLPAAPGVCFWTVPSTESNGLPLWKSEARAPGRRPGVPVTVWNSPLSQPNGWLT